jgi:Domain of unknown function (DUF5615)
MPRTIRFHLDENGDPAVAEGLRRLGIDATTTQELGMLRASDEAHLEFARADNRVIFTQDADFLRLHAEGMGHAGIAYCHQHSRSIGQIIQGLTLIWDALDHGDMANKVEFL